MEFLILDLALYLAMGLFWLIVVVFSFPEISAWIVVCTTGLNDNPHTTIFDADSISQFVKSISYFLYQMHNINEWGKLAIVIIPILIYLLLCHYIHIGMFYPFQIFGVIVSATVLWWFWGEIVSDSIWHVLLAILSTILAAGMRIKLHQTINRVLPNREERDRRFMQQSDSEHHNEPKKDEESTQSTDELMNQINKLSEQIAKSSHE